MENKDHGGKEIAWYSLARAASIGAPTSYIFCPLERYLDGAHPTHSMDSVIAALQQSQLRQCVCCPELNDGAAVPEHKCVQNCRDSRCLGVFRITAHGIGGPARNAGPGASLIVLREAAGRPWQVEMGVTDTKNVRFVGNVGRGAGGVLRFYVIFSHCKKKKQGGPKEWDGTGDVVSACHSAVANVIGPCLAPYALKMPQQAELGSRSDSTDKVVVALGS
mmetsp:Transcript_41834/g.81800  ORF Transcript_41834/g.81800 Transcript_41834/m.81800 type:complete len:220 (+) Transcript_41834:149-808(+)